MRNSSSAAIFVALIAASAPALAQGGGGGGSSGGSAGGGSSGSNSVGGSTTNSAAGSTANGNRNPVTRENGTNDNKAVPSPSATNSSSSSPSYGQSPIGAAATKSLSSTNTGVMANPNAAPPSSDNGNASVAPAGRTGDRTPSRNAR